jgi:phage regulator Rha-like protein
MENNYELMIRKSKNGKSFWIYPWVRAAVSYVDRFNDLKNILLNSPEGSPEYHLFREASKINFENVPVEEKEEIERIIAETTPKTFRGLIHRIRK